jgi:transposase
VSPKVLDTPEPTIITTEHRSVRKTCRCGTVNAGTFPKEATAPACYGPNIRAAALYLLHAQHIPVERTAEAMSAMLGANVSTGFVASLAKQAAGGLDGFIAEIRRRLRAEPFIHVDETSDQVRTDKWWFHVASSELYTYLFASSTRGKDAPDAAGVLPGFDGVMAHDRLAMYFKYDDAAHAICLAHIVRNLAAVTVGFDQGWAANMSKLLIEMNEGPPGSPDRPREAAPPPAQRLPRPLRHPRRRGHWREPRTEGPGPRLHRAPVVQPRQCVERTAHRGHALRCRPPLTVHQQPGRTRPAHGKVHKKISGCFHSDDGAQHFAKIRSYISTARKHGVGALVALEMLFRGDTWMPPNIA